MKFINFFTIYIFAKIKLFYENIHQIKDNNIRENNKVFQNSLNLLIFL
jgi:hypothetical protein